MFYKDKNTPVEKRVEDLMSRMTLEEKVAQLCAVLPHLLLEGEEISEEKLKTHVKNGLGRIPQFPMPFIKSAQQVAEAFNKVQKFAMEETRLGIPVMAQVECLNGVVSVDADSFPAPIAMASTWEPDLVEKAAHVIGQQMRAMTSGSNALAHVVDLARDPRWGRVSETYGECPYVNSAFGVAFVKGLQNNGDFTTGVQSCAKHFLGYSVTQGGLNSADIAVGERELYEAYARPFEAMFKEADLRSVMCTYSAINGIPVSFSSDILRNLLRDKLGFTGSAICDGMSIERGYHVQHAAHDMKEAGVLALMAGLDADAPVTQAFHHLPEAVRAGELEERYIDEACARVLKQKFDLGLFDNPYADIDNLSKFFHRSEDQALSLEICEKAVTLLKNEGKVLPLSKDTKKVAVIGPHGNNVISLFGGYTFPATLQSIVAASKGKGEFTMAGVNEGVEESGGLGTFFNVDISGEEVNDNFVENYCSKKYGVKSIINEVAAKLNGGEVLYAKGCNVDDVDMSGFEEAVKVAAEADVVVMTIGGRSGWTDATSGEGQDRTSIALPGVQEELLKAVKKAGKPMILVLFNGRPKAINWASENVDAILDVWFTGPNGGKAIANILFGDANPGGKLPITIPRSSGQVPIYYNHKNGSGYIRSTDGMTVDSLFGGGYTDISSAPLYYFGYGLSYTTFEYLQVELDKKQVDGKGTVNVTCYVKNTGDVAGDEVVQVYIKDVKARVTRPVKELVGFKRVSLVPGEIKKVVFSVNMNQLGFYNEKMEFAVEPGMMEVMVGSSSKDIHCTESFEITGEKVNVEFNKSYLSKCTVETAVVFTKQ